MVMGVDPGTRRVGLAVSDPAGSFALPLRTIDRTREDVVAAVMGEATSRSVERLVVGLPLNMDGSEGPAAEEARRLGEDLRVATGLPVDYWDERLTSIAAERVLAGSGHNSRRMRGKVDPVAASLILQGYLDRRRLRGEP